MSKESQGRDAAYVNEPPSLVKGEEDKEKEKLEARLYNVRVAKPPSYVNSLVPKPPGTTKGERKSRVAFPFRNRLVRKGSSKKKDLGNGQREEVDRLEDDEYQYHQEEEDEVKYDESTLKGLTMNLARKRRYKARFKSFTEKMIEQDESCSEMLDEDSFLYFVRKEGGTAYDLVHATNKAMLHGMGIDYYIVSSTGVTTQFGDGSTEFISMDQFEREFYLFSQIKQINFFRRYRLWKSFVDWKRNVRSKKINHCKTRLQDHLFILHPLLRSSLLELRKLCFDASSYRLFSLHQTRTYELQEFSQAQENQRETVRVHLETFSENVRELLSEACENALRSFLEENGFASKLDVKKKITFTERAAMRTQCRKLTKYIRLIDFFVIDTFLVLASSSVSELLNVISSRQSSYMTQTKHKNWAPIFLVKMDSNVSLRPEGEEDLDNTMMEGNDRLAFFPTAENFRIETENIIFDTLKVVTDPTRLLNHPDFALYVQPSMEEGQGLGENLDLEMMIVEDAQFQSMVDDFGECLHTAFNEAEDFIETFTPYLEQYMDNERLLQKLTIEQYVDKDIETFQTMLAQYTAQQESFASMPTVSDIGIVRIDSQELKELFVPSPGLCLKKIRQLIPEIMRLKSNLNLHEMRHKNDRLSRVSYSVDEFVEQLSFLRSVNENLENVDKDYQFVQQMFKLCQEFSVPLEEEDNTGIYMLKETNKALHTSIQASEGGIGENTARFAKELEEQIPRLRTRVGSLRSLLGHVMIFNPDSNPKDVIAYLSKAQAQLDELQGLREKYTRYQQTLGIAVTTYDELDEVKQDLNIKTKLWNAVESWAGLAAGWCSTAFCEVDPQAILQKVDQYLKIAVQAERNLQGNLVAPTLREKVLDFKRTMPVVTALRCDALQERHWVSIHDILGYEVYGIADLELGHLIKRRAMDHCDRLEVIATEAVQEQVLVNMLEKVTEVWKTADFAILQYKDTKDNIIGGVDDIIVSLDDSLVTINTILGSRYVKPIREMVDEWHHKLVLFQETLEEWLQCQRNWMYLESIFSAPDIQRQLPTESKLFSKIDASFRENMRRAADDPNALKCCTRTGLRETLQKHNAALEKIQKSLEDYLETKRAAFARFYFLSNDELLEILAQTKDPQAVQPHLRKCFDALVELDFGDQPKSIDIKAMYSPEGERIELGKNLKARGNVEDWLTAVEANMKSSLHKLMKAGLMDYFERPREEWVMSHPGQVVATVAQIAWVLGTECAIRRDQLQDGSSQGDHHHQRQQGEGAEDSSNSNNNDEGTTDFMHQFYGDAVVDLDAWYERNVKDLDKLTELVRGQLTKRERKIIVALVTTDVHARDIVETLRNEEVENCSNFIWQQQLRYYWQKEDLDDCVVRQSNSMIRYAYEYEGCTSRLVITPLTDRCWMTLTGALHLKLGGSPSGPAGTGKTESSKDLAKALGIQCIVFNCSDQIDYKMMAKLFSGLAQAGCWTCLDEFNRIDIEVLSVVAQQLLTLRQGRLAELDQISFEGREISLKEHHVIITMNPGYAGRTELPDNLKVLFRPVAMMVPNYSLIAEIMLFAEGFSDAKTLSRKMTKMYILCSEQLSQQCHYDYGLRAVKSVLVMAGGLKRGNPNLSEDVVLIRAMRDSNLPKFLSQDVPLFFGILSDLFPGVEVPYQDTGELQVMINSVLESGYYQTVEKFMDKIIQLYETMNVRFGITIVGPTGAGKTTAYRTLSKALTRLHLENNAEKYKAVETEVINPKCITMGELYGEFNELTQEWADGLASSIMRAQVASETEDSKWIVFDGPIDALWIENMNTVLDDNMTLCLANGERIKLKTQMKCVFEVQDLEVASPATVSRLGVLYMTPEDLGWLCYAERWLALVVPDVGGVADAYSALKERVMFHMNAIFGPGLEFLRTVCAGEPIGTSDIQLVTFYCNVMDSLLVRELDSVLKRYFTNGVSTSSESGGDDQSISPEKQRRNSRELLEQLNNFMRAVNKVSAFAMIWSLGSAIHSRHREAFDAWIRGMFEKHGLANVGLGVKGLVFDYFVDFDSQEMKRWDEILPEFQYQSNLPFSQLVVPTVDTVRYSYMVGKMMDIMKPCFLTGVTGTGKTVLMSNLLREREAVLPIHIGFSAQTSSKVTQLSIEAKLEKKRKTLLGAPAGTTAIICVDDVNMPQVEEYGAQPPIELLRQFLDFGGFYDREKLFFKEIQDTVLNVLAAPPGGGRNTVTPRFVRHFAVLCLPPPSQQVMELMFTGILSGYMNHAGFTPEVKGLNKSVIKSTIEVYFRISQEMLPTPAKSHYTFNLRDLSKVVQGILMIGPARCNNSHTMVRLWAHECMRVFHDRLISREDKTWFCNLLTELEKRHFNLGDGALNFENRDEALLFVDFLRGIAEEEEEDDDSKDEDNVGGVEERPYEEVASYDQIGKVLEDALDDYNISFPTKMNLVFFKDAVDHVSRISRILRQKRGNAMLVGVGGSGKQSLSRLAMFMCGMKCTQIEITKSYGPTEFREDIKDMMIKAGVQGKKVGFLLTDTQIMVDDFLEDINNILNTGEVPNLFPQDEMDRIVGDMGPILKRKGIPESRDNCKQVFVNRVRDNLHIVLCMSPVGNALRIWCRQFPSLINCCTIDWFLEWPQSALNSVASRILAKVELPTEQCREALVEACAMVHTSIAEYARKFEQELGRKVYATPKSYLDLIELYISMLKERRRELKTSCDRLSNGIVKLEETNEMVQQLKHDLNELMPVLELKSRDAEILLKEVAKEQAEASEVKKKVALEEAEVNEQAAQVSEVQADAQRDLDKAMPALESAIKSLDALDKKDITEMKAFAKPPAAVQTVMEAVNVLLGETPNWDGAKKVMNDTKFMDRLKQFDKDNIPSAALKKLKKYVEDPIMSVENVKKVSKAATSLCMWVHAMDVYSVVAKEVEPKRQRLLEMNQVLAEANAVLAEKQAALQEIVDKVNALEAKCDATLEEKNRLVSEAEKTKARLERAEKLTSGLASEGVRWRKSVVVINKEIENLVGDMFLASACISYYGPFTGSYRDQLVHLWSEKIKSLSHIPSSLAVDGNSDNDDDGNTNSDDDRARNEEDNTKQLCDIIGDPVLIREWQLHGLPTDKVSTNNAILAMRSKRWPLMIDPQTQAKNWIKQKESKAGLECIKMSDPDLLRTVENAVRNGKPLLVEDLGETIDPSLEPILQRAVFKQNGRTLIRIGDSDVDYDPNFSLFMTTKMANPHYLPEICIKVNLINFTVTSEGLEDQLLGIVVKKEKPDIEERKNRLLLSMAADQKQLKDIENKILKLLSESSGNILDDEELINTLSDSKTTSAIISERVEESQKTNAEVTEMRNKYRSVARRGTILYFVIANLSSIDSMYQYSLEYFVRLFQRCLDDSEPNAASEIRLRNILVYMNDFIFKNICRGLFEKDKLLFAFLIAVKMKLNSTDISYAEWNMFLRGAVDEGDGHDPNKDDVDHDLMSIAQENILASMKLDVLYIQDNFTEFMEWIINPEKQGFQFQKALIAEEEVEVVEVTPFQRLVMIKAFAEDRLILEIRQYVKGALGKEFVEPKSTSMEDIHRDMDCKTPCVFVLSTGADPTGILLKFAKEKQYLNRLKVISLGQGQGAKAIKLIEDACITGDWVLLQNCHLAKSFMPVLENVIANFHSGIHDTFRLFLTSMPVNYFPVSILQSSLKLTNEPPKGIAANLKRSFETVLGDDVFDLCPNRGREFRKLMFGLCFFHALIQERRKFGPLGWNIPYSFSDSDLEVSLEQLKRFINETGGEDSIPFDSLLYTCGEINYGGNVTDDFDRRLLMSLLNKFYTPNIFDDEYRFDETGVYFAPKDGADYHAYIGSLPEEDDPLIFGLHKNADITYQLKEAHKMVDTIISIEPRTAIGSANSDSVKTPGDIVISMVETMKMELPLQLDEQEEAGKHTFVTDPETGLLDPLQTFLKQEIVKYNNLLRLMDKSMDELVKAIRGLVVMDSTLDSMFSSIFDNYVPQLWKNASFLSLKHLKSWFTDVKQNVAFLRQWLVNGEPTYHQFNAFFFPAGFLTGALQRYARKYKVSINELKFDFEVLNVELEEINQRRDDGVIVHGLHLETSSWNRETNMLEDAIPKEMFQEMMPIHLLPVTHLDLRSRNVYHCPVYKVSTRAGTLSTTGASTNFVLSILLPIPDNKNQDFFIHRGVAMLLNL